jgi:hypothetical protein
MFDTKSGIFETKPDRYDAPRAPLERLADRRSWSSLGTGAGLEDGLIDELRPTASEVASQMSFDLAGIQASTGFDFSVLGSSCLMLPSTGSLASEIGRERVDTHGHGTAEHSATRVRAGAGGSTDTVGQPGGSTDTVGQPSAQHNARRAQLPWQLPEEAALWLARSCKPVL